MPYIYRGYKTKVRIMRISRKDAYAGPCEDLANSFEIKSDLCICDSN